MWWCRCALIGSPANKHFFLCSSKYPELFTSFKTLLGFKEPGLPEQLPTTSPIPPFPPKERVTEFAAEIGKLMMSLFLILYLHNYILKCVYMYIMCLCSNPLTLNSFSVHVLLNSHSCCMTLYMHFLSILHIHLYTCMQEANVKFTYTHNFFILGYMRFYTCRLQES